MPRFRHWLSKVRRGSPQTNGRIYLNAAIQPITIHRDRWGIPYIFAQSRQDLFFGQGFVHAQDRLWQMDLNRRAAKGTLSALFGKRTLQTDRLARTLGFGRLATSSWHCLSETAKADLQAYCDGVNAYLGSRPKRPFAYQLLHHWPQPWHPLDSLAYGRLQMWALTTGASSELAYAQLINTLGKEKAAELALFYPAQNPYTLPIAAPFFFRPFLGKESEESAGSSGRGSNGWVISPARSQSGYPILANDMHLPVGAPSVWHIQHLESDDGFKAAGFTQPGLPYVMIGHNRHIAWGATMSYTDGEDLFLEQFDSKRPFHYLHQGQWRQATQIHETIQVRGQKAHQETVLQTCHGPIISTTLHPSTDTPVALASVALKPNLTMDGFGLLNEATDWQTFKTAVSRIQAPSLNLLYADKQGNIGHYLTGQLPKRPPSNDGTQPHPGWTGQQRWQGTHPFADMPHAYNPDQGYIISANHKIVADDYPIFLGKMWRNGYRARRIEQLLQKETAVSAETCRRIQRDVKSIPAQEICKHLAHLKTNHPPTQFCLSQLQKWDHTLHLESVPATIYHIFLARIRQKIVTQLPNANAFLGLGTHPNFQPVNDFQGHFPALLAKMLDSPDSSWLPHAQKASLLLTCLRETAVILKQQQEPDLQKWRWQHHHKITFIQPLAQLPPLGKLLNIGPISVAGDGTTVQQSSMHPHTHSRLDFTNNAISVSTRMVVDLADWNQFSLIHAPGQSGHWHHPNYDDLTPHWQNGRLLQLPWHKANIIHHKQKTVTLLPQIGNIH